jgi:hypothetical protein
LCILVFHLPLSCISNVVGISVLCILDYSFGFL